ncbi:MULTISPECIES: alpha/beta fold hydrolase [Lysinibacillus]|uniref:alpha/beta fold hydrolase n=1 Tax=Lysinibacillus TaxID=400634 RepID=UPI0004DAE6F2|nr:MULTISPECIES: alpha/beta hydrolase [Lysinibacillus]AJK88484.1 hydrolase [Lysinibacillus fusiformis]KHK49516.1 hydrolase [Lysinibacillus sp. A1]MEE3808807.1 alpha/beta hydrolase [Lysinibacillus fusiformis]
MERKIEILSIGGISIEYSIIGKGEPILVLHGGHSNCREEFGYSALVEKGFSVITPSRPGYGSTSKEMGKSLSVACEYYLELLGFLNIRKVHLLAISAGGPSGIYFAARYPEKVCSLTLQSAVTKEWLTSKDKEYKAAKLLFHPNIEKYTWKLISMLNNAFPKFVFKQMFQSFSKLKYSEAREGFYPGDIEAIRKMNNRQRSGNGFFIDLRNIGEISNNVLQSVACPTFIMHSKYDGSVSLEHAYFAHENIISSELCLLDTWGHLIWLGKSSKETDQKIITFLVTHNKLCSE